MSHVLLYLGRFALLIVGYAAASLAASAFINLVFFASAGFRAEDVPMLATGSFVFTIPFVALFVAYFAFIPSVPAILLAEILGKRDWLFYALAGGLIGLAVFGFFWQAAGNMYDVADALDPAGQPAGASLPETYIALVMAGAGMCGGIAHWLVAGRMAGDWRDAAASTSPGPSGS